MKSIKTVTIAELRELLSRFPDTTKVAVSIPSGDYWGTVFAGTIDSAVYATVTYTDYRRQYKIVDKDSDTGEKVVILS